jgi:hypothetical protein
VIELVNSNNTLKKNFLNLIVIQLKLLKALAQISLSADTDKRRTKNKCKKVTYDKGGREKRE